MALQKSLSNIPRCCLSFPVLSRSPWNWQGSLRTLYSSESMGLDGYEKARSVTRFNFREDLKDIVHLAEDKPTDYALVLQMLKKFNQQNEYATFSSYSFGPVVMRMYHFLNEPTQALVAFRDKELDGMFHQLSSLHIICDLLYRNGMYQDVLGVLEVAKAKQVNQSDYPRTVTVLALASCWKMVS
ncbi:unnamed protein product [Allacma fusca]|uniref:Pentatricopeptide repeat-containing protein n=1 Tax=Allacma fusca TaxID=39272 RepID=A0A8J2NG78_9HEXA|nr:unnamed protein product [Allacma fusca]